MHSYFIYGICFSTDISFYSPLPPSTKPHQLYVREQNSSVSLTNSTLLYSSPEKYLNPATLGSAHRFGKQDILVFPGGDQIAIDPQEITYHHVGKEVSRWHFVDLRVLGSGFAWWLLQQGRLGLHAGAIVVDGEAVLLMAESGMGKSTLLCSLVTEGYPLLCDDFVAIDKSTEGKIMAYSAYPQMRLWPTTIKPFIGDPTPFVTVAQGGTKRRVPVGEEWGRFLVGAYPISRIYLLNREESTKGSVKVERIEGHQAFMHLLTSILMGSCFPSSDLQPVWTTIEQIVNQIPLYNLSYPTGWPWLPEVQRAILQPPT